MLRRANLRRGLNRCPSALMIPVGTPRRTTRSSARSCDVTRSRAPIRKSNRSYTSVPVRGPCLERAHDHRACVVCGHSKRALQREAERRVRTRGKVRRSEARDRIAVGNRCWRHCRDDHRCGATQRGGPDRARQARIEPAVRPYRGKRFTDGSEHCHLCGGRGALNPEERS